jgi:hypothetical protein
VLWKRRGWDTRAASGTYRTLTRKNVLALRGGSTEGKTDKGGFTMLALKSRGTTTEAVLKGEKAVVKMEDGWKTLDELSQPSAVAGCFSCARCAASRTPSPKRRKFLAN